jgi:hypothetical protein
MGPRDGSRVGKNIAKNVLRFHQIRELPFVSHSSLRLLYAAANQYIAIFNAVPTKLGAKIVVIDLLDGLPIP